MEKRSKVTLSLRYILIIYFLHSLLYLSIVPPWQGNDEVWHLEYAELIRRTHTIPKESDTKLIGEIVSSMYTYEFWKINDLKTPDRFPLSWGPAIYKASEIGRPPLYYIMCASLFSLLPEGTDIITKLYIARIFSMILGIMQSFKL